MSEGQNHHHNHSHEMPTSGKRLLIVILLNFTITIAEIIGGIISGSLSLLSDALHNFSDGIAVIIAWIAMKLDAKPRSSQYTFGLKRAQILAAIINASALVAISIFLFVEAWDRYANPQPIEGAVMTTVAIIGLLANVIGTWLLHQGSKENMNLKATYLHLFSDAISSVAVILGGLAIMFYDAYWVDPLLTVLIGIYVMKESIHILWRALGVFMLASPNHISSEDVAQSVLAIDGVEGIHHIHLWELAEHDVHFEAHITMENQSLSECELVRFAIEEVLHNQFEIHHVTLQTEPVDTSCGTQTLK